MPRGRSITFDQEMEVIALYRREKMSIKEIMSRTGVKSEQTIYRILDTNNVPRRPKLKGITKIVVTLERDVADAMIREKNISLYVNNAVRFYEKNKGKK